MVAMNRLWKVLLPLSQTLRKFSRRLHWIVYHNRYAVQQSDTMLKYSIFQYDTTIKKSFLPSNIQYDEASIHNIVLAIRALNGIIIDPGQTFSFWKSIGAPTKLRGYKKGISLRHNKIKPTFGSGINQLANIIHWIALHSPLTISERHRHPFDLFPDVDRRVPFGTGVTCIYGIQDLQIYNDTHMRYQLLLSYENGKLTGRIVTDDEPTYTYEVYEKEQRVKQISNGDYIRNNKIYRKMFNQEQIEVADDFIMESNARICYRPILAMK